MLAANSAFIGHTQTDNPFASDVGPFNPKGLECAKPKPPDPGSLSGNYCLSKDNGLSMPITNFMIFQRLFSIYDGPAYQFQNAYLDITPTALTDCNHPTRMKCGGIGKFCASDSECDNQPPDQKVCLTPMQCGGDTRPCQNDSDCAMEPPEKRMCLLPSNGQCNLSKFMYGRGTGVRYDPNADADAGSRTS